MLKVTLLCSGCTTLISGLATGVVVGDVRDVLRMDVGPVSGNVGSSKNGVSSDLNKLGYSISGSNASPIFSSPIFILFALH